MIYTDIYRCIQTYTDVYKCIQMYADVYRCMQAYTDVCRCIHNSKTVYNVCILIPFRRVFLGYFSDFRILLQL